jgi:hypothetical protein
LQSKNWKETPRDREIVMRRTSDEDSYVCDCTDDTPVHELCGDCKHQRKLDARDLEREQDEAHKWDVSFERGDMK